MEGDAQGQRQTGEVHPRVKHTHGCVRVLDGCGAPSETPGSPDRQCAVAPTLGSGPYSLPLALRPPAPNRTTARTSVAVPILSPCLLCELGLGEAPASSGPPTRPETLLLASQQPHHARNHTMPVHHWPSALQGPGRDPCPLPESPHARSWRTPGLVTVPPSCSRLRMRLLCACTLACWISLARFSSLTPGGRGWAGWRRRPGGLPGLGEFGVG